MKLFSKRYLCFFLRLRIFWRIFLHMIYYVFQRIHKIKISNTRLWKSSPPLSSFMLRHLIFAKFFVLTAVKRFASKYSLRHKSSPLIAPYDRASNLNSPARPGWRPDEIIFRLNGGSWIPSECAIKPMPATCLQFYEVSAKCTTQASYIRVTSWTYMIS